MVLLNYEQLTMLELIFICFSFLKCATTVSFTSLLNKYIFEMKKGEN